MTLRLFEGETLIRGAVLPHDLLGFDGAAEALVMESIPGWAIDSLRQTPMVVVRRAFAQGLLIPVGVRGGQRNERLAAFLSAMRVARRVRPEELVSGRAWAAAARAALFPHFAALDAIAESLAPTGLSWGPAGSLGFELASGHATITAGSDIDLVLRAPEPLPRALAAALLADWARLAVRIDAQVEVPAGAVSLAEYASGAARIVLRTEQGPRLIADPWKMEETR